MTSLPLAIELLPWSSVPAADLNCLLRKKKSAVDGCVLFQGVPVQVLTSILKGSSMVVQKMQKGGFNVPGCLLCSYSMQEPSKFYLVLGRPLHE